MIEQPKNFCILPFYGKEIYQDETTITCCIMEGVRANDQIKSDMLAGIQTPACKHCWKLEALGKQSDRQIKNGTLDSLMDKDIRFIYEDCKNGKNVTNFYKIFLGNVCNAACTTCSGFFSSKWNSLENKKSLLYLSNEYLDKEIDYANAVFISFAGGEPFLQKNMQHVIYKLLEHNNTNCSINVLTNGSIKPDDQFLKSMKKFKSFIVSVSIDGIGSVFNYTRWPLDWNVVKENIAYLQNNNITVSGVVTLSNLNILHLEELENWFKETNMLYHVNPVTSPKNMVTSVLPIELKKQITHGVEYIDLNTYDDLFAQFCKTIQYQDKLKKIDIRNYIPKLGSYIYSE